MSGIGLISVVVAPMVFTYSATTVPASGSLTTESPVSEIRYPRARGDAIIRASYARDLTVRARSVRTRVVDRWAGRGEAIWNVSCLGRKVSWAAGALDM